MALFGEELVTRTKFLLPRAKRTYLRRLRLHALLDGVSELPVTAIVAGTGYGKSSLLAGYLEATGTPALWYELSERDADPQLFALHLAHLCHRAYPGAADRALGLLALPGAASRHGHAAMEAIADALLDRQEADTWLVLDDFHLLHGSEAALLVNQLIQVAPPRLHLVLSTRQRPELPDFARMSLEGEVLQLDQATLAFQPDELAELLRVVYQLNLSPERLERLMRETEGWPMALQLAARRLKENPDALWAGGGSLRDLFDYLAQEVLGQLEPETREFLLTTAPLTRLEPALCDALAGRPGSAERLRELNERGLFLIPLEGGAYRHHHLFREFLLARLSESERLIPAHRAAAEVLLSRHEPEDAVEHLLAAGDAGPAAELMAIVAPALVSQGRYARISAWLEKLPQALLERAPALAVSQGDACRLASRFEEAIAWYDRAARGYGDSAEGRARAIAGKALVYLDTVRPALATTLLEEALALGVTGRMRAELLVMLAENRMNLGDAATAEKLFREARHELPEAAEHEARICLRTGRLAEARKILETGADATPDSATRAHREAALVLALIACFMGEPEQAAALARKGLERARAQGAPWTEAVALMRLGHADLTLGQAAEAEASYREAIALARAVGVSRLKAEPLMGLALLAARRGVLAEAESLVKEGLEVTQETGDAWVSAMLSLALGAAYAEQGDPKAERWLLQAQDGYERCGDPYGEAMVALAAARLAFALGENKTLIARVRSLSELARRHDYGFLLCRPTLLGFASVEAAKAFAAGAIARGVPRAMLAPWLEALGLEAPSAASADMLRIRTLGAFRVWRGQAELSEKAWSREKARQLLHVLIAHRGQLLPKSRIIDLLWPEADPASADGTFRVALNALMKALEPDRPSGRPGRFVLKQGTSYGLSQEVWLDVSEFERSLDAALALESSAEEAIELYRSALELCEGPFLAEYPQYDAWCERERERLADRFREGAMRLARLLLARGDAEGAAVWAQRMIEREPCAEEAYRVLMLALYMQGDRAMAIKTYDRLVVTLDEELDVDPMPETQALYEKIANLSSVEALTDQPGT